MAWQQQCSTTESFGLRPCMNRLLCSEPWNCRQEINAKQRFRQGMGRVKTRTVKISVFLYAVGCTAASCVTGTDWKPTVPSIQTIWRKYASIGTHAVTISLVSHRIASDRITHTHHTTRAYPRFASRQFQSSGQLGSMDVSALVCIIHYLGFGIFFVSLKFHAPD